VGSNYLKPLTLIEILSFEIQSMRAPRSCNAVCPRWGLFVCASTLGIAVGRGLHGNVEHANGMEIVYPGAS